MIRFLLLVVGMLLVLSSGSITTTCAFVSHRHFQHHGRQSHNVIIRSWWRLQNRFMRSTTSTATTASTTSLNDNESSSSHDSSPPPTTTPQKIAIVGGGLAGLSTAYHILDLLTLPSPSTTSQQQQQQKSYEITILDKEEGPGIGGASAVAGGLVHPLSPRGKLVHWGLEGLEVTNQLIDEACRATDTITTSTAGTTPSENNNTVVLRTEIFRIATTDKQARQLQKTSQDLPQIRHWMERRALIDRLGEGIGAMHMDQQAKDDEKEDSSTTNTIKGGLRLHNGCKVIHLPSYLRGLWAACQMKANVALIEGHDHQYPDVGMISIQWKQQDDIISSRAKENNVASTSSSSLPLSDDSYDAVVWAAGSGLFDYIDDVSDDGGDIGKSGNPEGRQGEGIQMRMESSSSSSSFPIQLVRGQSVEVQLPSSSPSSPDRHSSTRRKRTEALLSGKYISPLPEPDRVLVGATHEFQKEPMSKMEVKRLLQEKTNVLAPHIWKTNNIVPERGDESSSLSSSGEMAAERYTTGVRVQSQRGAKGRLPIVGRIYDSGDDDSANEKKKKKTMTKHWIFTGLSSRGLLYHGVYGKVLAQAILEGSEECLQTKCPDYDWWRKVQQPKS